MDRVGNGDILPRVFDELTGSWRTESQAEALFVRGVAYTCRNVIQIPTGTTEIWFDPTAYTPPAGFAPGIVVDTPLFAASEGPVVVHSYFGATYTGGTGTQFSTINRDAAASKAVPDSILILGPTKLTNGVAGPSFLVPATGSVGAIAGSGAASTGKLPVRLLLVPTRLEVVNISTNTVYFEFNVTWYEI